MRYAPLFFFFGILYIMDGGIGFLIASLCFALCALIDD